MADQSHAQPTTSPLTTTGVFAVLTAREGITREEIMAIMPAEIRATVALYLQGKIREWHSRSDGRGAVFLLNAAGVEEAAAIMDALPLGKADLLDHEYIPVGPLRPLGLLLQGH